MIAGSNNQTNNGLLEKYCYNNDPANCATYGGLYQWAEVVQYQNGASNSSSPTPSFSGFIRGICPTGWHIPSDAEYCILTTCLDASANCTAFGTSSTTAGGMLKSTSGLWTSPNTGATNSSGFSALPGGYRLTPGTIYLGGYYSYLCSSSDYSADYAIGRNFDYNNSNMGRIYIYKANGYSVRCIKD